jgi:hypothetical protein
MAMSIFTSTRVRTIEKFEFRKAEKIAVSSHMRWPMAERSEPLQTFLKRVGLPQHRAPEWRHEVPLRTKA